MATPPLEFFTICARNYASHAAALAESLRQQHPESKFSVWLLAEGPTPECLRGIAIRDIQDSLSKKLYLDMRLRYDVVEFCTAVKPRIIQQLMEEGAERLVYLDPDIYVFQPFEEIERLLDLGHLGVLTAHSLSPILNDGLGTDDYVFLMAGVFNLGFFAIQKGARTGTILDWWWTWLQTHASQDHRTGLFTDQKWMGLAPAYWPELVLTRDIGYNVAFWNLHERSVGKDPSGKWTVSGQPLVFYHFSGYDPELPDRLTKYEHQRRFVPTEGSPLRLILDFYAERLRSHGLSESRSIKVYRPGFDQSTHPDEIALKLARQYAELVDPIEPPQFLAFLKGSESGRDFPRYVDAVLAHRPDVATSFDGRSLASVVEWMLTYGIDELNLSRSIVEAMKPTDYDDVLAAEKAPPSVGERLRKRLGIH